MKIIVTCGPSYEPIDQVRRLTNFSTGELGVRLSSQLAAAGMEVICMKGSLATFPGLAEKCRLELFNTNDDLLDLLAQAAAKQDVAAVFHVAALCDYKVKSVTDQDGQSCDSPKIASRSGALTVHLEPATKVISRLRGLFPRSLLVGWKFELAGTRAEALAKAQLQIAENKTDACVLNGAAYGRGYALCQSGFPIQECLDKAGLVQSLVAWFPNRVAALFGAGDVV